MSRKQDNELGDWFAQGLLKFGITSYGGIGVFAKKDIPMSRSLHMKQRNCIGVLDGELVTKHFADTADRKALRYVIHIDSSDKYINLVKDWTGRINHRSSKSIECNLETRDEYIYQTRSIKKGQELCFSYGCEYWVFQISGIELDDWIEKYPHSEEIWIKMYETIDDYTDLLALPIEKLTPKDLILLVEKLI